MARCTFNYPRKGSAGSEKAFSYFFFFFHYSVFFHKNMKKGGKPPESPKAGGRLSANPPPATGCLRAFCTARNCRTVPALPRGWVLSTAKSTQGRATQAINLGLSNVKTRMED